MIRVNSFAWFCGGLYINLVFFKVYSFQLLPFINEVLNCAPEEVRHACTNHYKFSAFGLEIIT